MPNDILAGILCSENDEFIRMLYAEVKRSVEDNLVKSFDIDFGLHKRDLVHFLEDFISYSGWGKLVILDLDFEKKRAIAQLEENPFAKFIAKNPADHIMRGILAGFFSKIFEEEIGCVEICCALNGAKHCEFVIKKIEEFDFSKKEVRRQLKV